MSIALEMRSVKERISAVCTRHPKDDFFKDFEPPRCQKPGMALIRFGGCLSIGDTLPVHTGDQEFVAAADRRTAAFRSVKVSSGRNPVQFEEFTIPFLTNPRECHRKCVHTRGGPHPVGRRD